MITDRKKLNSIFERHLRLVEASKPIRQVEIPKPYPASKKTSKPVASKTSTNVKSSAKSTKKKLMKKPEKKSVPDVKKPKKTEHIQGDSNKINFEQQGQQFTGWIEKRGEGKYDIVIVKGQYSVVKSVTEDDVSERVRAAAAKMIGGTGSKSQKKKSSDVLLPPEDNDQIKD